MNYQDILLKDMRLGILQLLQEADGYDLNAWIIRSALDKLGHQPSVDQLETQLNWLAENQLITISRQATVSVAKLTQRGEDVADGRITTPGVRRPAP